MWSYRARGQVVLGRPTRQVVKTPSRQLGGPSPRSTGVSRLRRLVNEERPMRPGQRWVGRAGCQSPQFGPLQITTAVGAAARPNYSSAKTRGWLPPARRWPPHLRAATNRRTRNEVAAVLGRQKGVDGTRSTLPDATQHSDQSTLRAPQATGVLTLTPTGPGVDLTDPASTWIASFTPDPDFAAFA